MKRLPALAPALVSQRGIQFMAPLLPRSVPGLGQRDIVHLNPMRRFGSKNEFVLQNFHLEENAESKKEKSVEEFKKLKCDSIQIERGSVINSVELVTQLLTDLRERGIESVDITAHSEIYGNDKNLKSVQPSVEEIEKQTDLMSHVDTRPKKLKMIGARLATQKISKIAGLIAKSSHSTSWGISAVRKFSSSASRGASEGPLFVEKSHTVPQILSYIEGNDFPTVVFDQKFVKSNELPFLHLLIRISKMNADKVCFTAQSDPFYEGDRIELFKPDGNAINQAASLLTPLGKADSPLEVEITLDLHEKRAMTALLSLMLTARRDMTFRITIEKHSV